MKISKGYLSAWVCACFLFLSPACEKDDHFLYYVPPAKPPQSFSINHRLSDITQGNAIDILWVVDNSHSMAHYQASIIDNLDAFIDTFTKGATLDWKMGLISSDRIDDPYVGFTKDTRLDKTIPNANDLFKDAVRRLGTSGDGVEKFFLPIKLQLTKYPDFSRKDATLAIMIVTDTEDQSEQDRETPLKAAEVIDFLRQYKGSLKKVVTYDVLGASDFGCPVTDDGYNHDYSPWSWTTSRQKMLFDAAPGKVFKLCDPEFGKNLVSIGKTSFSVSRSRASICRHARKWEQSKSFIKAR